MTVGDCAERKLRYATASSGSSGAAATPSVCRCLPTESSALRKWNTDHFQRCPSWHSRERVRGIVATVLHEVAELMPRRGLVVLVSDLYTSRRICCRLLAISPMSWCLYPVAT